MKLFSFDHFAQLASDLFILKNQYMFDYNILPSFPYLATKTVERGGIVINTTANMQIQN
jgi:AAA+ superfamily predicted ATPase